MGRNATASGLYVGSRADFEALNAFLDKHRFKPAIDKVFEFGERAGRVRLHGLGFAVRQGGHPALTAAAARTLRPNHDPQAHCSGPSRK